MHLLCRSPFWIILAVLFSFTALVHAVPIEQRGTAFEPDSSIPLPASLYVHRLSRRQGYGLDLINEEVNRLNHLVGRLQHDFREFNPSFEELPTLPPSIVQQRKSQANRLREAKGKLAFARKVQKAHRKAESLGARRDRAANQVNRLRERLRRDPNNADKRNKLEIAEGQLVDAIEEWQQAADTAEGLEADPAFDPAVHLI